jgi:GNAT superfamily N-acetyltransferase
MKKLKKFILKFIDIQNLYAISVKDFKVREMDKRFDFRLIKEENLENLKLIVDKRGADYKKLVSERLQSKDEFAGIGVFDKETGLFVYTCWIRFKSFYESKMRRKIEINENEGFFFDAYCHPDFRGNGFHGFMLNERIKYCFRAQKSKAFIIIQGFNTPALKLRKKYQYKLVKKYYRIRWELFKGLFGKGKR